MSTKRRKRTKTVVINERDRELFNYLYEVKVATQEQISRDVYKGVTKTVVYRRLKKLIHMKYLKRSLYFNGTRAISAYSLSKTGLRVFIFNNKSDEYAIKRCLSDSIEHDIILNDIRQRLLSCDEVKDYYSENVLASNASIVEDKKFKGFKKMHSDGMIFLQKGDEVFHLAVEYEHTLKYAKRYERLFFDYRFESDITAILYICRDKKVLKRVKEAELKETKGENQKTFFALVDDILAAKGALKFKTSDDKRTLSIS